MKKIKMIYVLVLCILLGMGMGLYSNHTIKKDKAIDERMFYHNNITYKGFDSLLEDSDVIVKGTVNAINIKDSYDEYVVVIDDTKKGDAESTIIVRNYMMEYSYEYENVRGSGRTSTNYEVGESYIFILQHIQNVYQDVYMIMSDSYLPLDDTKRSSVLSRNLDETENILNCESYIDQFQFECTSGKGAELSLEYIRSDNIDTVINKTKYIAEIKVKDLYRSTDVVDVYNCDVVNMIKGNMNTQEGQVIIPFFKGTVESGNNYIVCLDSDSDEALIYTLSSKISLLNIDRIEFVKDIVKGEDCEEN